MRRVVYALGLLGMYGCETAGRGFSPEDAAVDAGADVPRDAGPSGVGMRCSDEQMATLLRHFEPFLAPATHDAALPASVPEQRATQADRSGWA